MNTSIDEAMRQTTVKQVLPYQISLSLDGRRVFIRNTRGEVKHFTQGEICAILANPNLADPHRRNMYEEALAQFPQAQKELDNER